MLLAQLITLDWFSFWYGAACGTLFGGFVAYAITSHAGRAIMRRYVTARDKYRRSMLANPPLEHRTQWAYMRDNELGARCGNCNRYFEGYTYLYIPEHVCKSESVIANA